MPPISLLIKPASSLCNLNCTYCFYRDISKQREIESYGMMTLDTLEQIVAKALQFADQTCTFAFQGGEPTLIGLDFYRALMKLEEKYNQRNIRIVHALQTNGYRLSEEWAEFFAKHQFLVGVSLDGTVHTHARPTGSGESSFSGIMSTIDLFKKHHVDFNILTVVHRDNAQAARKIYTFFRRQHFEYMQFIPCLDPLEADPGSMPYSLTPEDYGEFLCELFDQWYPDVMQGTPVSIRTFDNYLSILRYGYAEACDMNGHCSVQHVVEADGSVYPCDFYVLDQYRLGNLTKDSFEEIAKNPVASSFISASLMVPESCKVCPYAALCRNGCRRVRLQSGEMGGRSYFCQAYQTFFKHALPQLKALAMQLER